MTRPELEKLRQAAAVEAAMQMVTRDLGTFSVAFNCGLGSFGDDMVTDGHWDSNNEFQSYFRPGTSAYAIPGNAIVRPR